MPHVLALLLIALGVVLSGSDWVMQHGLILLGAGGLMLACRSRAGLPGPWWGLSIGFVLLSLAGFLPADPAEAPDWRQALESEGVATGGLGVIEIRHSLETLGLYVAGFAFALWLLTQRVESPRRHAAAFVGSIAIYALISWVRQDPGETFGFFPNRNHTASLLAMGALCGMGLLVQSIRDRCWWALTVAAVSTVILLWGLFGWSMSRAGLVLVIAGIVAWLPWLGRGYLGRHAGKAIALMVLAAGGMFVLTENPLKGRFESWIENQERTAPAAVGAIEDGRDGLDGGAPLDFRVLIWRDTLGLLAASPWTGVGPGQFRFHFPQHRQYTLARNDADAAHPESDGLWWAAEVGVPATLCLVALVFAVGFEGWRQARKERQRALRLGCVVAALLLALHGVFDVPGHRLPLVWAAAWLISIALPQERPSTNPAKWPMRVLGGAVVAAGAFLVIGVFGPAELALGRGDRAQRKVLTLYRDDEAQQAAAAANDRIYQPEPNADPLLRALEEVDAALEMVPLDRRLWYWRGFLALHYDDRVEEATRAYRIERILDPAWIGAPLRQGQDWASIDPGKTASLWREALERAEAAESNSVDGQGSRKRTLDRMRSFSRGRTSLNSVLELLEAPTSGP